MVFYVCAGVVALAWLTLLVFFVRWLVTGKWPFHTPGERFM